MNSTKLLKMAADLKNIENLIENVNTDYRHFLKQKLVSDFVEEVARLKLMKMLKKSMRMWKFLFKIQIEVWS
jgi:hypothetical protein